jgi:hypothetical protein
MLRREKSFPYRDSKSDPLVLQPVASHYTTALCRVEEVVKISYGSLQSAHQEKELNKLAVDHGPSWERVLALLSLSQDRVAGGSVPPVLSWVGCFVSLLQRAHAGSSAVMEKQLDVSGPW